MVPRFVVILQLYHYFLVGTSATKKPRYLEVAHQQVATVMVVAPLDVLLSPPLLWQLHRMPPDLEGDSPPLVAELPDKIRSDIQCSCLWVYYCMHKGSNIYICEPDSVSSPAGILW